MAIINVAVEDRRYLALLREVELGIGSVEVVNHPVPLSDALGGGAAPNRYSEALVLFLLISIGNFSVSMDNWGHVCLVQLSGKRELVTSLEVFLSEVSPAYSSGRDVGLVADRQVGSPAGTTFQSPRFSRSVLGALTSAKQVVCRAWFPGDVILHETYVSDIGIITDFIEGHRCWRGGNSRQSALGLSFAGCLNAKLLLGDFASVVEQLQPLPLKVISVAAKKSCIWIDVLNGIEPFGSGKWTRVNCSDGKLSKNHVTAWLFLSHVVGVKMLDDNVNVVRIRDPVFNAYVMARRFVGTKGETKWIVSHGSKKSFDRETENCRNSPTAAFKARRAE